MTWEDEVITSLKVYLSLYIVEAVFGYTDQKEC